MGRKKEVGDTGYEGRITFYVLNKTSREGKKKNTCEIISAAMTKTQGSSSMNAENVS